MLAKDEKSLQIRALNDAFRTQHWLAGSDIADNTLVITRGASAHGNDFIDRAVDAVSEYSAFTEENDPYGEHDFGSFEIDGVSLFWKIDYYDRLLEWGSPDPADPAVTRRVLTILLADEYWRMSDHISECGHCGSSRILRDRNDRLARRSRYAGLSLHDARQSSREHSLRRLRQHPIRPKKFAWIEFN